MLAESEFLQPLPHPHGWCCPSRSGVGSGCFRGTICWAPQLVHWHQPRRRHRSSAADRIRAGRHLSFLVTGRRAHRFLVQTVRKSRGVARPKRRQRAATADRCARPDCSTTPMVSRWQTPGDSDQLWCDLRVRRRPSLDRRTTQGAASSPSARRGLLLALVLVAGWRISGRKRSRGERGRK